MNNQGTCPDNLSPFYGWKTELLKIFEVLEKKPNILLVGSGGNLYPLPINLAQYLKSLGIQYEVLSSKNAIVTFDMLVEEGRSVALALLPNIPTSITGEVLVKLLKDK